MGDYVEKCSSDMKGDTGSLRCCSYNPVYPCITLCHEFVGLEFMVCTSVLLDV